MRRIVLAIALTAAAGCGSGGMKMNNPFQKAPAAAASADYFEVRREGKTYVLGSADSLQKFNEGSSVPCIEAPALAVKGKPVLVENSSFTGYNRLVEEYKKAHNIG